MNVASSADRADTCANKLHAVRKHAVLPAWSGSTYIHFTWQNKRRRRNYDKKKPLLHFAPLSKAFQIPNMCSAAICHNWSTTFPFLFKAFIDPIYASQWRVPHVGWHLTEERVSQCLYMKCMGFLYGFNFTSELIKRMSGFFFFTFLKLFTSWILNQDFLLMYELNAFKIYTITLYSIHYDMFRHDNAIFREYIPRLKSFMVQVKCGVVWCVVVCAGANWVQVPPVHTTPHVMQGRRPHWIVDYSRYLNIHCHDLEEYCL